MDRKYLFKKKTTKNSSFNINTGKAKAHIYDESGKEAGLLARRKGYQFKLLILFLYFEGW